MRRRDFVRMSAAAPLAMAYAADTRYEANWESLDRRPSPQWYADAKFGIRSHWGPQSAAGERITGCSLSDLTLPCVVASLTNCHFAKKVGALSADLHKRDRTPNAASVNQKPKGRFESRTDERAGD